MTVRPTVGETYRWAGKRWKVTAVDTASRTAAVVNVDRPTNTARLPWAQFKTDTKETEPVPRFHRIAPGDYETADGTFRLVQLDGGATRAWNVEYTTDYIQRWIDVDPEHRYTIAEVVVDGAATKRDALALFADWFAAAPDPYDPYREDEQ